MAMFPSSTCLTHIIHIRLLYWEHGWAAEGMGVETAKIDANTSVYTLGGKSIMHKDYVVFADVIPISFTRDWAV